MTTHHAKKYAVLTIPLSRPEVTRFLLQPSPSPGGVPVEIVGQRPTEQAEAAWHTCLSSDRQSDISQWLEIDHPRNHLYQTWTDRLVPVEFLPEDEFLTRNLGGWAPIYFGVFGLAESGLADEARLSRIQKQAQAMVETVT